MIKSVLKIIFIIIKSSHLVQCLRPHLKSTLLRIELRLQCIYVSKPLIFSSIPSVFIDVLHYQPKSDMIKLVPDPFGPIIAVKRLKGPKT